MPLWLWLTKWHSIYNIFKKMVYEFVFVLLRGNCNRYLAVLMTIKRALCRLKLIRKRQLCWNVYSWWRMRFFDPDWSGITPLWDGVPLSCTGCPLWKRQDPEDLSINSGTRSSGRDDEIRAVNECQYFTGRSCLSSQQWPILVNQNAGFMMTLLRLRYWAPQCLL